MTVGGASALAADVLVDTSVVVKWFRAEQEEDLASARALLDARQDGRIVLRILDLTYYELGNVLARPGRLQASEIAEQLDELGIVCGEGLPLTRTLRAATAEIAVRDGLTFYDAAYVAVALAQGMDLVTADTQIIAAGGGESPRDYAVRSGLL